jgi:DNA mismatch repair protein MutS2
LNRHSLHVLELERLRAALVDRATFGGGMRRIRALSPSAEADSIAVRLRSVSEVRRILEDSDLPIHGVPDLVEALAEAEPEGAILTGPRLAPVAKSLRVVQRLTAYLHERREALPELHGLSRGLSPLAELRELVDRHLEPGGEIRDDATPVLRRIRRDKERVRGQVNGLLRKLARSLAGPDGDPVVTLRNDRYLLGVRRDRLQGTTGIVHGQSGSGHSVYLEPGPAVALNNELAELRSAEAEEIRRILEELTGAVRAQLPALAANEEILSDLDSLYAAGRLSRDLDAVPALPSGSDGAVVLRRARHPGLALARLGSGDPVVPLDLELGGERPAALVITGPNTGGKTVALKTVGLLVLMNQCGLHVPAAEGTRLPLFRDVFADIGDEQSIEASLSTFSSHMAHVIEMLRGAGPDTLVLLDELGVGTDPEEGAALGKAILSELADKSARAIVTTHYGSLKVFAHDHPGLENASLEFDRVSLSPTYRFLQGVPGASEALSIAQRLGFPERLVEEARSHLGGEKEAVESLLQDLSDRRRALEERRARLEQELAAAAADREKLERRLRGVAEERARLRKEALEEARRLVDRSKAELSEILGAVKADGTEGRASGRARTRLGEMARSFDRQLGSAKADESRPARPARPEEIRSGVPVRIPGMGWKGTALGEPGSNGKVAVSVGSLRVEVPVDALEVLSGSPGNGHAAAAARGGKAAAARQPALVSGPEGTTTTELDLRGRTVEEAVDEVDRTLDGLVISGGSWLRIIHGKGTGALRSAVTEQLEGDPRVKSFRLGEPAEGGSGVTIAVLK